MRLFAHVRPDGSIEGLISIPSEDLIAMLVPSPGIQVCEIIDHGLQGDAIDPDQLRKLHKENTVAIAPAQGKFVPRKKE